MYAYQSSYASSSYGCAGQYRTCSNGYLNGSYQYSSCTTHDNYDSYRCDLPRGGSIANGSSITAYNNSSSPCYSQTRTCTNGTLNGSYQYSSCTTVSHNSCSLPWGGSIADGSSVTAYSSSSSPCSSQTRTCNDGSLNGSYQYSSCSTIDNGGGQDSYGSRQSAGQKE